MIKIMNLQTRTIKAIDKEILLKFIKKSSNILKKNMENAIESINLIIIYSYAYISHENKYGKSF